MRVQNTNKSLFSLGSQSVLLFGLIFVFCCLVPSQCLLSPSDLAAIDSLLKVWPILGDVSRTQPAWSTNMTDACDFHGIHCDTNNEAVISLNLDCIALGATIPTAISNFTHLVNLSLANAGLTGPIPSALTQLADLVTLNLKDNGLSGNVPAFANFPALQNIDLRNNALFFCDAVSLKSNHLSTCSFEQQSVLSCGSQCASFYPTCSHDPIPPTCPQPKSECSGSLAPSPTFYCYNHTWVSFVSQNLPTVFLNGSIEVQGDLTVGALTIVWPGAFLKIAGNATIRSMQFDLEMALTKQWQGQTAQNVTLGSAAHFILSNATVPLTVPALACNTGKVVVDNCVEHPCTMLVVSVQVDKCLIGQLAKIVVGVTGGLIILATLLVILFYFCSIRGEKKDNFRYNIM